MNIRVIVAVLGFLLSACGDESPSVQAPVETVTKEPVEIVLPVPAEQPEAAPPQSVQAEKEAEAEVEVEVEVATLEPPQAHSTKLATATLDLRVPQQLLDQLRFDDPPLQEQTQSLLPPMFVEKSKPERKFRVGGSLFTTENLGDGAPTLKSIDGAELQLEYKP